MLKIYEFTYRQNLLWKQKDKNSNLGLLIMLYHFAFLINLQHRNLRICIIQFNEITFKQTRRDKVIIKFDIFSDTTNNYKGRVVLNDLIIKHLITRAIKLP